ncbi:hypothetical protein P0M11_00455 [Kaistella sp. PBT33-4]|uniref:hypothetical protein n=1 Tax=Kaistella sp. PBT33-4 TaxID=3032000 RepID=UPI0023D7DD53|nr:hypothetical protein [Kaistella sp. PBT33-4]MDF0718467.1 hypothetical protein [Kaistella sp. PBT33-4]
MVKLLAYERLLLLLSVILLSCNKNIEEYEKKKLTDTLRIIDSVNAARTVYNDSIRTLNKKDRYRDISGSYRFTHSEIAGSGKVRFTKNGRDEYNVSGKISSGSDFVAIEGKIKAVTMQYLNFEGVIEQKINGKKFRRTAKTSFKDEKKGPYWRLQDKKGGEGFVEYIDIHF